MSVFSDELRKKIEGYLTRYETKRSAILPVLHAIQDEHGWVSPAQIEELHETYGLDRVSVKEVITFYDIYNDEPVRKYTVRYCTNLTCTMLGAKDAVKKIEGLIAKLDSEMGEDGPFCLEKFPCLGKCDGAPVMLVNKTRHEHATADKVEDILSQYAKLPK